MSACDVADQLFQLKGCSTVSDMQLQTTVCLHSYFRSVWQHTSPCVCGRTQLTTTFVGDNAYIL